MATHKFVSVRRFRWLLHSSTDTPLSDYEIVNGFLKATVNSTKD